MPMTHIPEIGGCYDIIVVLSFCHTMLCIARTVLSQYVCPSVHLSYAGIVSSIQEAVVA